MAARAAGEGRSLQEYMLALVSDTAAKPSMTTLIEDIRAGKRIAGVEVDTAELLAHRDADRA